MAGVQYEFSICSDHEKFDLWNWGFALPHFSFDGVTSCRVETSAGILAKEPLVNERTGQNVKVAMAEWLRRLTRNQMGSPRVGSSPARDVFFLFFFSFPFCVFFRFFDIGIGLKNLTISITWKQPSCLLEYTTQGNEEWWSVVINQYDAHNTDKQQIWMHVSHCASMMRKWYHETRTALVKIEVIIG